VNGAALYMHVANSSRVEGASPHSLVAILFEEALEHIGAIEARYRTGQSAHQSHVRAMSLLYALESSLDYERGGQTAELLQRVYREGRRCLTVGAQEIDPKWCQLARDTVKPIAEAWQQIGQAA
jgi:flagellar secretion chaperone FliS